MKVKNPLLSVDMPDPDVLRVGDTWYMVSTTMFFMPGGPILRSRDLCHWEIVSYLFDSLADHEIYRLQEGKNAYGCGQWATSLTYHDGWFHACFACNDLKRTFFARTRNIEESGWELTSVEGIYHDMSFLFWEGTPYLVYGNGSIHLVELTQDLMGVRPETDRLFLETPKEGMSLRCEGCRAYVRNGFLYLLFIDWPEENGRRGLRREVCYRSRSLDGPFECRTLLYDDAGREGCGVAQGPLIDTAKGDWYALMFQDRGAVGRIPYLMPVAWEEDWPVLGIHGKVPMEWELPMEEKTAKPLILSDSLDHPENRLNPQWQWNHSPCPGGWSFTERPGYLRLKNLQKASFLMDARNTLTQRTAEPASVFTVTLDASGLEEGDFAGLCALEGIYGQIGLAREADGWYLQYVSGTMSGQRQTERIPAKDRRICLKAVFTYSEKEDRAAFFYRYDDENWQAFGAPVALAFTLDIFVGCRIGLFSYGTSRTGGFADFKNFCFTTQDETLGKVSAQA